MILSIRTVSLALIFSGLFQALLPAQAEEYSPEEYLRDIYGIPKEYIKNTKGIPEEYLRNT